MYVDSSWLNWPAMGGQSSKDLMKKGAWRFPFGVMECLGVLSSSSFLHDFTLIVGNCGPDWQLFDST